MSDPSPAPGADRSGPIRVVIVDDHSIVRAGLHALLDARPELIVVAEADSGAAALAVVAEQGPDVVLCDLRLGAGLDGVGVTRTLRAAGPDAPAVLILTTYDHDADIVRAVEAGAAGYLLKDADPDQLVAAIVGAAGGERIYSDTMNQRVIETMRTRRAGLSDRELEALALVAGGMSNREVARAMFVSEATVKTHLNHAFTKLGVDSRTAAVAAARSAGLIG
ncbi:response regulator [Granulicoccus phenolivorans]|uniref:response regulator n=1 Tax=Granulicoccus phenolivorans TaxID=266854 RepID=UPI0004177D4D|nr:response regulator transcription factor [Granulicoccus phenolivorans]